MATALRSVGHEDRLSLVEHLTELRVRIVICLIAFACTTGLCIWQNQRVLNILNRPLAETTTSASRRSDPIMQGTTYNQLLARYVKQSSDVQRRAAAVTTDPQLRKDLLALARSGDVVARAAPPIQKRKPVTLGVSEPFMQTLKVSAYAGLLLSLPVILYQLFAFVLPAFSPREKQVALPIMLAVPFLFIAGVVFGYYTVVPRAIYFLQNFNTDSFDVLIQAQPYYKFVLMLLISMGLLFQIPIGVIGVTRVGIVSTSQIAHNRRYAILLIAVVAMLLPGQDPVTMSMMMLPMYVLFEASILFSWLLDRRTARSDAAIEDEDPESSPEHELVTIDQD
jgi:sec-independent protein translocase protein TatC